MLVGGTLHRESELSGAKWWTLFSQVRGDHLRPLFTIRIGQTPDLPATHARLATVAPFPVWRGSPALRCAEPEV
jgi:hypothetical protein